MAPDTTGTPARPDFDAAVNGFLSSRGLRGASVAVAKEGRIVYARSYGAMDDAGTPVRVDTRFRFASISKVITAAAVLQLVQAGALSLDDSVFALLADRLPLVENPDPRLGRITVKDLLNHTSGFTKSTDPFFTEQPRVRQVFGPSGPKSCLDAAAWFVTLPLANNPGSTFNYVNMNYCLLSLLVEKYTGEDYDKVVQSLVLERRNVRDARIGASFGRKPDEVAYRGRRRHVPRVAVGCGRLAGHVGRPGPLPGRARPRQARPAPAEAHHLRRAGHARTGVLGAGRRGVRRTARGATPGRWPAPAPWPCTSPTGSRGASS